MESKKPKAINEKTFPIRIINRAKQFTLRRMHGSLENRIQKFLSRTSLPINKVRLVLLDENGPKGGFDKRCSLQISLAKGGAIAVEGQGTLFARALTGSLEKMVRVLQKKKQKSQSSRRKFKNRFMDNQFGNGLYGSNQFGNNQNGYDPYGNNQYGFGWAA